ncbi:hypothetical protein K502DRAFT_345438 [Neoconidiobolus thromboides FSU 785]|nr:hypothetical protein K502DRAFT_345438 [Neoconidiobolus thromboides FSU 785]
MKEILELIQGLSHTYHESFSLQGFMRAIQDQKVSKYNEFVIPSSARQLPQLSKQ